MQKSEYDCVMNLDHVCYDPILPGTGWVKSGSNPHGLGRIKLDPTHKNPKTRGGVGGRLIGKPIGQFNGQFNENSMKIH